MKITSTGLSEVKIVEPRVFLDERGFLLESYRARMFQEAGIACSFVQDNHSRSQKGVLRGLHYQISSEQDKLVRVVRGAIFDVAVDIRRGSPTHGKWVGVELTEDNHKALFVPAGFAHGYIALSDDAIVAYKASAVYAADAERSLRWDDAEIGIEWPEVDGGPILSPKDLDAPLMADADTFP